MKKAASLDCETFLIRPGLLAPPLVCVSFWEGGPQEPQLYLAAKGVEVLRGYLRDEVLLVGQNVAYDFAVACAYDETLIPEVFAHYEKGLVADTKIRQQLLDIAAGLRRVNGKVQVWRGDEWVDQKLSLADLEQQYLGIDRSAEKNDPDAWRLNYHKLHNVPLDQWPQAARDYAIADAVGTYKVAQAQDPAWPAPLVNEVEQVRKAFALHLMSVWGLRTDKAAVDELDVSTAAKWQELQDRFVAEGFFRLEAMTAEERRSGRKPDGYLPGRVYKSKPQDPPKPAKLTKDMEVIRAKVVEAYKTLGKPAPVTDKGAVATDRDSLTSSGDPLLAEFGAGGPIATIRQTFLPTLRQGTEVPINTSYNSLLETGRISSYKPNLNNLPRVGNVRECFVPRPGFVFASVDYDCAELRSLAQVCLWLFGFSKMAEFFQANPHGDPHLEMAATLLGISPEEAAARKKAGDPEIKNARQSSKALNFGLPGGLGIKTFVEHARASYGVYLTEQEARVLKAKWLQRWPEMDLYFNYISNKVGPLGASIMQLRPGGLPHRVRGEVGYCDGANGYFQALTADGAGHALWRVSHECYVDRGTALFGSRPVMFLYDQCVVESPVEVGHEAALRLAEVMIESMREWLRDVPVTASPVLMKRFTKDAEPTFDEAERLVAA